MAKEWSWAVSHTLDSKQFSPYERGTVRSAHIKNQGSVDLHIYGFGIEFEWQRKGKVWYNQKCDIFLEPEGDAELPVVGFNIPIDLEARTYEYKVGVQTESKTADREEFEKDWIDHGIVWGAKNPKVQIRKHTDRDFKVFFSHTNHDDDKKILKVLSNLLSNNGISYLIAEETPKYGEYLWRKIKSGINSADRVIILWTEHATESGDVREEIGITLGARKKFIPVIEEGVEKKGSLIGTEHIQFNRDHYGEVFNKLTDDLINFANEKAKRKKRVKPEESLPL